jgi:ATP-binding cassette subfamily G (WHITE) protein 2 (SNQ2)
MEIQKPNKGGGAVTIFKRGQVPKTVEKAMEVKAQPGDIEAGEEPSNVPHEASDSEHTDKVEGVAKNETICRLLSYGLPVLCHTARRTLTDAPIQLPGRTSRTQSRTKRANDNSFKTFRAMSSLEN